MPDPEQMPGPRRQDPMRRPAGPMGVASGYSLSLAGPWNVIGPGLPPSAELSAARGVVYPGGANLTGPPAVLATHAAVGTMLTLAATAWRRYRLASRAPQRAAQAAAAASLAA